MVDRASWWIGHHGGSGVMVGRASRPTTKGGLTPPLKFRWKDRELLLFSRRVGRCTDIPLIDSPNNFILHGLSVAC